MRSDAYNGMQPKLAPGRDQFQHFPGFPHCWKRRRSHHFPQLTPGRHVPPPPGCKKEAGVPVEHKVAENLFAICPALPIPVVRTLPLQFFNNITARSYSSVTGIEDIAWTSCVNISATRCLIFMAQYFYIYKLFKLPAY